MKPRFVWIVQADHLRSWQVATGNDVTLDSTLLLATNTSRREKIAPADIRPRTHPPPDPYRAGQMISSLHRSFEFPPSCCSMGSDPDFPLTLASSLNYTRTS